MSTHQHDEGTHGILLNLLPEERIVYRARHGALSFAKGFPSAMLVATNKRVFVIGAMWPFGTQKSIFYDKIASIDVKHHPLGSRFIININAGKQGSAREVINFTKASHALSAFSIISNRIAAAGDSSYDQVMAHGYTPSSSLKQQLGENAVYFSDKKALGPNLAGFIRASESESQPLMQQQQAKPARKRAPRKVAQPVIEDIVAQVEERATVSPATMVVHSFHTIPAVHHKDEVKVEYFAGGRSFSIGSEVAASVQGDSAAMLKPQAPVVEQMPQQKQGHDWKRIDPDKDLQIFRIRHIRSKHERIRQPRFGSLSLNNLFNLFD